MNVEEVPPFSNVGCPVCGEQNRVKLKFGPYTLVRRHAVGGMSMVFVAEDPTLHREVALKILSEDFSADERRITAFEEEARITASFSHPNVVRVLTTGKAFGRLYIAMELVPGGHFEHQIQERGSIPEIEMLPLAIEIAQGLKAAHAAGLIHRDVKPGNILLDAEGHAKLVDFGLALVTQGGKAKAAEIWATPYYVPPETIEGFPEDFRSDIYAFGATLYHALAGKPSCGEETMSTTILRDAKKKVIPVSFAAPWLSEETCKIVQRSMAYDPKDRFGSYDELISRLDVALKRLQTGTAGVSSGTAARRRAKTKRAEILAYCVAGLVISGALMGGIWWVVRSGPRDQNGKPLTTGSTTSRGSVVTAPDSETATEIARIYREAREAVVAGNYEKAAELFIMLRENSSTQEPSRTWAGVEAVVVGYLDGKPDEARRHTGMVLDHIGSLAENQRIDSHLVSRLEELGQLKPVPAGEPDTSAGGATHVMGWMLAGLKNWEQGLVGEGGGWFAAVSSAKVSADEEWLSIYQKLANDYQEDLKLLQDPVFAALPDSPGACREAIEKLDKIHGELRTRGRARYNVRAWQLDIKRQSKLLGGGEPEEEVEKPAPAAPVVRPELSAVMEKVVTLVGENRFTEAYVYLKDLPADPEGATKESLMSIVKHASVFFPDMEVDLAKGSVATEILTKSGERGIAISAGESGMPLVTGANGRKHPVSWAEISPDSLITLHRILVKGATGEIEKMRRHQCAISYDWLAGNRTRALQAAGQLSQTSSIFKDTWDKIVPGLPQ